MTNERVKNQPFIKFIHSETTSPVFELLNNCAEELRREADSTVNEYKWAQPSLRKYITKADHAAAAKNVTYCFCQLSRLFGCSCAIP